MHSAILFVTAALAATLVLAAPAPLHRGSGKRAFRVNHRGRGRVDVRQAYKHAHRKYGWNSSVWSSASDDSTNSTAGGGDGGSVTATPDATHGAYTAPVIIGGQQLTLDFDTGSSDLWVFSTLLPAGEGAGHTLFNPQQSSTFASYPGASWMTTYGDGSAAAGSVGFDTVNIGGAVVQKQCVELAEKTEGFQSFTQSDGLLGLGFSSLNTVKPQQQKTFWENILPDLAMPVFTADLDDTASGSYDFGSIDASQYSGSLQYAAVDTSSGYWQVESNTNTIGGQVRKCTTCSPAVMDTGTTLMLIDADVAEAYYAQVQGARQSSVGYFEFPCSSTLPDFGVAIGNNMVTLKGADLVMQQGSICLGGIQPISKTVGLQIYGDVFFKQYFTVFDGGNAQVGVAAKA